MRCSKSLIVFVMVPMSHPRTTLDVVHVASPCFIFFRDAGSCQKAVSLLLRGENTLSNKQRRILLTHQHVHRFPCTRPQKLSTYISQYRKGFLKGAVYGIDKMLDVVIGGMSIGEVSDMESK